MSLLPGLVSKKGRVAYLSSLREPRGLSFEKAEQVIPQVHVLLLPPWGTYLPQALIRWKSASQRLMLSVCLSQGCQCPT